MKTRNVFRSIRHHAAVLKGSPIHAILDQIEALLAVPAFSRQDRRSPFVPLLAGVAVAVLLIPKFWK